MVASGESPPLQPHSGRGCRLPRLEQGSAAGGPKAAAGVATETDLEIGSGLMAAGAERATGPAP